MAPKDVADLAAFLRTLPPVTGKAPAHALAFPFSIRRAVGLWKLLYFDNASLRPDPSQSEQWNRGRYLVEGPGHCGECHTPRNFPGAMDLTHALAGAPMPDGHGKSANLRGGDFLNWTEANIVEALTSGFTPGGDVLGAGMTAVVRNLAQLPGLRPPGDRGISQKPAPARPSAGKALAATVASSLGNKCPAPSLWLQKHHRLIDSE